MYTWFVQSFKRLTAIFGIHYTLIFCMNFRSVLNYVLQKSILDNFLLTLLTLTTRRPSLFYPTMHTYKHELFFGKISTVELIVEEL
jgi:hypothetical protein